VNKDQVVYGVSVTHPTCAIIHDEHVQEFKELAVKDDSFLAAPHPLHPDIPCDSPTTDFPYANPFPDVSTSDHSHDTLDVSISLHFREDTSSSKNLPNLSSIFPKNIEGEHRCFPSTPLSDSSNHDDVDEHLKFSNLGCCDLFTSSFDHDVDPIIVNMSKTLVYDDISFNEVYC